MCGRIGWLGDQCGCGYKWDGMREGAWMEGPWAVVENLALRPQARWDGVHWVHVLSWANTNDKETESPATLKTTSKYISNRDFLFMGQDTPFFIVCWVEIVSKWEICQLGLLMSWCVTPMSLKECPVVPAQQGLRQMMIRMLVTFYGMPAMWQALWHTPHK